VREKKRVVSWVNVHGGSEFCRLVKGVGLLGGAKLKRWGARKPSRIQRGRNDRTCHSGEGGVRFSGKVPRLLGGGPVRRISERVCEEVGVGTRAGGGRLVGCGARSPKGGGCGNRGKKIGSEIDNWGGGV